MAASTSRVRVKTAYEGTWGLFDTTPANWRYRRITGEGLKPNISKVESQVIRPDGQIDDVVNSDAEGGGPIRGELQFGEWDREFHSALRSVTLDTPPTTTAADMTFHPASVGVPAYIESAADDFSIFNEGDWVVVSGAASSLNNRVWKVISVDDVAPDRLYVHGGVMVEDLSVGESVTITKLADWVNGVSVVSQSIEKEHTDDTDEFWLYTGQTVNRLTLRFPTQGPITVEAEFGGKVPARLATTIAPEAFPSGTPIGTITPALTSSPMTSGANVLYVFVGNPELTNITNNPRRWDLDVYTLVEGTITYTPNYRQRKAVGTVGPALTPGTGDMRVEGSLRLYYNAGLTYPGTGTPGADDYHVMEQYTGNIASGLAIVCSDSSNRLIFEVSELRWTNAEKLTPAKNEDVILACDFLGTVNTNDFNRNAGITSGVTARIARTA